MGTKVFAISTGEYSDWRITSLHWTRKQAETARDDQAKRYKAYQEDYKGEWVDEPNEYIQEFEIAGEVPPALLKVWNKLVKQ